MKELKKLPKFNNEDEERAFWNNHSSIDYLDWNKGHFAKFTNLKPSTQTISFRLPKYLLSQIKAQASYLDVPYQSYMKTLLADRVREKEVEYGKKTKKA